MSLELVKLREDYPEEFKQSILYDIFKNFDAGTGYDLPFYTDPYFGRANELFFYIRTHPKEVITYKQFYKYDIDKYLGLGEE